MVLMVSSPPSVESIVTSKVEMSDELSSSEAQEQAMPSSHNAASKKANSKSLKVLFLSSDTGGGHRASAESLARQFELLYPGSTYELLDLASEHYPPPYRHIVSNYKHLSANPSHWKLLYGVTNSRVMERPLIESTMKFVSVVSERAIRKRIKSIQPDVVVSVHPLQTSVPILSCAKISHETGKHLPMFTVVTDLGSGHCTWFANGVEKMFVGSSQIYDLAKDRGKLPDEKLVLLGLPIRHDFAVEAEHLGDRWSPQGKDYQVSVREKLELPCTERKTLLVMGGGEGVGSLSNIVDALYCELSKRGIDALILVVCGRNQTLQNSLKERNWDQVLAQNASFNTKRKSFLPTRFDRCGTQVLTTGCIEAGGMSSNLRKVLSSGNFSIANAGTPLFVPTTSSSTNEGESKDDSEDHQNNGLQFKCMSFGALEFGNSALAESVAASSTDGKEEEKKEEASTTTPPSETQLLSERSSSMAPSISATSVSSGEEEGSGMIGNVSVVGLGFVTNMAEYMVAADILISKAGPGTISEAAAVSLPVLLTSYLPGQEEGNVDYVVDGKFGAYCDDSDPTAIGKEISEWLLDEARLEEMSRRARSKGAPHAARDIVQQIGDSTLKWREVNEAHEHELETKQLHNKHCS